MTSVGEFGGMKVFHHAERVARYQARETVVPVSVDLCPSDACNHRCVWCVYREHLKSSAAKLERATLMGTVRALAALGVKGINITGGGEPLLNRWTIAAIELAAELGLAVGLITNGSRLTPDICARLAQACRYVRISLDAATPETYGTLHRVDPATFPRVMRNIEALASRCMGTACRCGVQFLIVSENRDECAAGLEQVKQAGAHFAQVRPARDVAGSLGELPVSDAAFFAGLEAVADDDFAVFVRRERFRSFAEYGKAYPRCVSTHFVAMLGADGKVYTCCEMLGKAEYVIGSFREESLDTIFAFPRVASCLAQLDLAKCPRYCKTDAMNQCFDALSRMRDPDLL